MQELAVVTKLFVKVHAGTHYYRNHFLIVHARTRSFKKFSKMAHAMASYLHRLICPTPVALCVLVPRAADGDMW